MTYPKPTPLVASLPATVPFVGPETQERARGAAFNARLGANENVFGPSPKAVAAMQAAASEAWMYADPEHHALKQALGAHHGIGSDEFVIGEGIDGLLGYLVRIYVGHGDAVVTSDGAYPTFNYHVAGFGGTLHKVPYKDDHEDLAALTAKVLETNAKLVYLSNPDNPMGTWHPAQDVVAFAQNLPPTCLLVLDEAYIDTAPAGTAPAIGETPPNVIRMRTFSKAYGLAGARVGYAIGAPRVVSEFAKIKNHFGMSRPGLAAALGALQDQDYLGKTLEAVENSRKSIAEIATANGLQPLASATNFVAIDCGQDGAFAKRVLQSLIEQGVFVRMPFVAPQDRCIRISCGTDADLLHFKNALPHALTSAQS
ncbi:pyridoxal phosphate-dependent aminotransferase [Algirhabdus cladophorae]|uniref:pyridoxal phosphate-dependent aminotransferase n=1 Tax=Algirhabdus cladophorae TaxID=3377108 RepID=UPI003B847D00